MFNKLKSFANELFTKVEDSIQNLEPLENKDHSERQKENKEPPEEGKKGKSSIFSNFNQKGPKDQKFLETPSNVWDIQHLDQLYSEQKIKKGMDTKFYRLVSEYGKARRYLPPDVEAIKEFCASCRDIQLMMEAMAVQRERQKEIDIHFSDDFLANDYEVYSTTDWKSDKGKMIVLKEFNKLPPNFRNRDLTELSRLITSLVKNKKSIVKTMTRNNMKNSDKYFRSFNTINAISVKGEGYIERVEKLRNSLSVIKQASVEKNLKITKSFSKKLSRKKALYILKKIRDKYSTSIKYAFNGLRIIPFKNYPDIYKVFAATLIILKSDLNKYPDLKILKNLNNCLESKLSKLRRKMEFQLTSSLKKFRDTGLRNLKGELELTLNVYRRISSEALGYSSKRNGGFLKQDCDLLWSHFGIISKREESLGDFRIENRIRNWIREKDMRAEGVLKDGVN